MKIKFGDLYKEHKFIENKLINLFKENLKNSSFIGGEKVKNFEKKYKKLNGSKFFNSTANGTDSILIALKALKIKQGHEVIVPAHTWISTSESVTNAGGKVVFCDVCPKTFNIDTSKIQKLIGNKTAGIIAVHLYGNPADMFEINKIAKKKKLWVIEDCAQAHFASIQGKKVGNFGNIGTFSFFPGKNLGALGDAGGMVTNSKKLFNFIYKYSRHGSAKKGKHEFEGINSRLDTIQADFLKLKLQNFISIQKKREKISNYYQQNIQNSKIIKPHINKNVKHAWHRYVIKCQTRNHLKNYLLEHGIETAINYPVSLPFLRAYKNFRHTKEEFPIAFENQRTILSLPNHPMILKKEMEYLVKIINKY
jgi:dTDP-4-amino-4,6-dideoxygalactose transaminase